jgi:D-alanyl-D-alanine carboxypeptidase (penicillin-binding protein 5/6)
MAGVKTGYTPGAGKCLVALAERGGARALLVVLNAPNRWEDVPAMLDHAFLTNKLALQGR